MSSSPCPRFGDTSVEIDAIATRWSVLEVAALIGDFVWDDSDADGIQDPDEQGIANVTVNG